MKNTNFARNLTIYIVIIFALACGNRVFAQSTYYPPPAGEVWEKRAPERAKIDAARLKEAVDFAIANESKAPRNLEQAHYQTFGREPFGEAVGAFKERGDATGIILKNGYTVAEWGAPDRVEMTFSVTKSFVSTVVGLAFDRKLIKSLQDPARNYSAPILIYNGGEKFDNAEQFGKSRLVELFETEHNRKITWEHLLRQTSDWEGTL